MFRRMRNNSAVGEGSQHTHLQQGLNGVAPRHCLRAPRIAGVQLKARHDVVETTRLGEKGEAARRTKCLYVYS